MDKMTENMQLSYNYLMYEAAHPTTSSWWLVPSPVPVLAALVSYYYFCTRLGPQLMRGRPPFQLKNTLIVYNVCQVSLSLYMFYYLVVYVTSGDYNLLCMPIDYSDRPSALWIATAAWWYYFSKLTELLDTIFFVLRKKERQVSTLHVYHHMVMLFFTWIGAKYAPGGQATVMALLNSFVHAVMYSYYLVSGLGPRYQKYLWWKRHLTTLQLIQFFIVALHNLCGFFSECAYPKTFNVLMTANSLVFIYMFGEFYYHNYIKKKKHLNNVNSAVVHKNK